MIFSKKNLTRGVAVVAASAAVALTAVPAFADPVRPYATVGSDTIQDVWNGLTNDSTAVAPSIASYNATSNGVAYNTIQTKTGGAWFTRPNGSGDGAKAVCATWDTAGDPTHLLALTTPASTNSNLTNSEVDFSRSSSGPSTGTVLDYLPFARDAVSIGYNTQPVGSATSGLSTTLNLTTADITALYTGNASSDGRVTFTTSGGVAENPATTDATAKVFLDGLQVFPTLPQGSSGTRKFFAGAAGISNTVGANAAYVSDAAGTVTGTGAPYEENSGRPLLNPGTIIPFSAAQWISQQQGAAANTLTSNMAIASINGQAAVTGSGSSAAQGPLFGSTDLSGSFNTVPTTGTGNFNRDTYNVIPASFVSAGTPKQSALVSILTGGGNGQLNSISAGNIIHKFGFGTLSYSTGTGSALPGGCASGY
jgi:hypothetical protein